MTGVARSLQAPFSEHDDQESAAARPQRLGAIALVALASQVDKAGEPRTVTGQP
jgi:hypothetical protein